MYVYVSRTVAILQGFTRGIPEICDHENRLKALSREILVARNSPDFDSLKDRRERHESAGIVCTRRIDRSIRVSGARAKQPRDFYQNDSTPDDGSGSSYIIRCNFVLFHERKKSLLPLSHDLLIRSSDYIDKQRIWCWNGSLLAIIRKDHYVVP